MKISLFLSKQRNVVAVIDENPRTHLRALRRWRSDTVGAAIDLPWSNGQTDGQITKLTLVKRQMYGRGKLDLLQARMLGAN
jgi:transposase